MENWNIRQNEMNYDVIILLESSQKYILIFFTFIHAAMLHGMEEIISFFPTNQNTLHWLCLFYSDNDIITVHDRPAICTLIGWVKSSRMFNSLSGFCEQCYSDLMLSAKFSFYILHSFTNFIYRIFTNNLNSLIWRENLITEQHFDGL